MPPWAGCSETAPAGNSSQQIHVRVRKLSERGATIAGYTTQIFFSDADNDAVLSGAAPYNARSPNNDPTTDESDTVLLSADVATNVVAVSGNLSDGFTAAFNIELDHAEVVTPGSPARPNAGGSPPGPWRDLLLRVGSSDPGECTARLQAQTPSKTGPLRNCGTGTRTPNFCSRGRRVADYTIPQGVATGRGRRSAWPRSEAIIGRRSSRLGPGPRAGAAVARPLRLGLNTATAVAHAAAAA